MIVTYYQHCRLSVKDTFEFVNRLTPKDVLEYFEESPHLCQYADDLRHAPLFAANTAQIGPESDLQLQQDVDAVEQAFGSSTALSLADIAEVLTGNRYYGGRVYYRLKRVLAALIARQNTSTSGPEDPNSGQNTTQGLLAA